MADDVSIAPGEIPVPSIGSEPELIYHYTGLAGFHGITSSAALWASDVWFMNDTVEATYGRVAIERFLRKKGESTSDDKSFCNSCLEVINVFDENRLNSYIACLSEEADLLSQWRAYGQNGGVSIGFDRRSLEILGETAPGPLKFSVRKVAYGEVLQDQLLEFCYVQNFSRLPKPIIKPELDTWSLRFILDAVRLSPALKNPAFSEEKEYRLHVFLESEIDVQEKLKFRNSAIGVTPYLELPLRATKRDPVTAIRKVIVGPQRHQNEAIRAVRQLLLANNVRDVDIVVSKIPLRD